MQQLEIIDIFTDGACSQGAHDSWPGGWATVIYKDGDTHILQGGAAQTTNNEMELQAFLAALRYAKSEAFPSVIINIYTDSAYISNCFEQKWYVKWKKNNWVTASKTPVKHRNIWEEIINIYLSLILITNLNIIKVKGHSDVAGNILADQTAVKMRDLYRR